MRVALVGPELEENLSLRYLAAALSGAGYSVQIVAFNRAEDVDRVAMAVLAGEPGLVGFSLSAQRRYEDFGRLARLLRSRGYYGHLTAGGHFAGLRAAVRSDGGAMPWAMGLRTICMQMSRTGPA